MKSVFSPFLASFVALVSLLATAPVFAQSPAPAPVVAPEPTPPADSRPETVISSDELDMVGGDEANHFYFRGNVKVQATNMIATADELEVISARQSGKDADGTKPAAGGDAAAANIGSIREIIMRGNVVISQEGRRATAGIAYLYPQEGRVVLAENPQVTDAQGTLSGWRMELFRGERKVRILSNPDEKQRTRVTLPALQDLGYSELGDPATATATQTAPADAAPSSEAPASASGAASTGAASTGGSAAAGAANATGAHSGAASGQSAAGAASTAAGSGSAATPSANSGTGTQPAAGAAAAQDEPAAAPTRSGGWNPVNSRRR